MKTDYEFIKNKIDESEINAPESMDESFVLDKIADIKPQKSKKPFIITGLSAAAALAIITVSAFVLTSIIGNTPKPVTVLQSGTAKLSNFKSADDVKKAIRNINREREKIFKYKTDMAVEEYNAADGIKYSLKNDAAAGSASPNQADYGHNSTYTQYTNVDEADTVKTDGRYIYYRDDASKITVFSAEGKNSKKVAEIKPAKGKNENEIYFNDFYIHNNKLIAIEGVSAYNRFYQENTQVEVFDISDINNIKRADSFYQSGSCCSSRMIGSALYVVSNHAARNENDLPKVKKRKGATGDEATPDEIPCGDIYTVESPSVANFLVVSSINTEDGAQVTKTKAVLGSADTVYCNTEHLFVTAAGYSTDFGKTYGDYSYYMSPDTTQIVKVDLNNDLEFTATAKVKGYIDNQYSLDEKDGYLRIAVTADRNNSGNRIQNNRLYILDEKLNLVGKTKAFAENESIKAVRYIDDTAYVITYEQTDPLFVIDTSNVNNPTILGEVKISGFSTMLVPVDENTLLGIGYHTQDEDYTDLEVQEGIKLALFDVSDKANPKVLDEKIFKNYGSDVQNNPKALLVNFKRNDYTIPYSKFTESGEADDDYGVINFKVDSKKIKIVDEYKSDKFFESEDESNTLDRCVYSGNYIYMLGTHYDMVEENDDHAIIDAVEYK